MKSGSPKKSTATPAKMSTRVRYTRGEKTCFKKMVLGVTERRGGGNSTLFGLGF